MTAQLIAATVNFSMGRPEKSVKATDFMPSQWAAIKAKPKSKKRRMTKAQRKNIAETFRAWAGFAPNGKQ